MYMKEEIIPNLDIRSKTSGRILFLGSHPPSISIITTSLIAPRRLRHSLRMKEKFMKVEENELQNLLYDGP